MSLDRLLATKSIAIFCGPGGVGKTSVAAASAAVAAERLGGKVLVVTVDPAKRLADALGLSALGNLERPVPADRLKAAGLDVRQGLWAAMLDTKQSWDNLVVRHAPDKDTARRILENPLYQNISGKFVQSHEYIAMERLYEIHLEGHYDLLVVDTPPTRNALDFLEAPERMADFFSSRFLRMLTVPYRSRLVNLASKPFYQVADRILGSQVLEDIAEFFILFQTMNAGFIERADAVTRLLHDRRTTFVVVSTLEAAPLHEAEFFIDVLGQKGYHLGAVILNKVLPSYLLDEKAARLAGHLCDHAGEVAKELDADVGDTDQVERVLREVAENFRNYQVVAQREAEQRAELAAAPDVVASVPYFDTDIYDIAGLLRLAEQIWN